MTCPVRSVSFGEIFGTALSRAAATPFLNQNGRMFVTLAHPDGAVESRSGILAFVEIEVKQPAALKLLPIT